jgi:hypothetical protein
MNWRTTVTSTVVVLLMTGCREAPPSSSPAEPGGPALMQAARTELATARQYLDQATPDRGGHREQAMHMVDRAVWELDKVVAPQPVPALTGPEVPPASATAAPSYIDIARGHVLTAMDDLRRAPPTGGGQRERAMEQCTLAVQEIDKGIAHVE